MIADRALYVESLDYAEVLDEDLRMFIDGRGVTDPGALAAILRIFRAPRAVRSFRRVEDLLDDLREIADGGAITAQTVREAMEFVRRGGEIFLLASCISD